MNTENNNVTPTILGGVSTDENATICSSGVNAGAGSEYIAGTTVAQRYKIEMRIGGKTSQAQVYCAKDLQEDKTVVIKIYASDYEMDVAKLELLKQLNSPYLVKLLEYGTFEERHYEVYQYYKNGSILDWMKEKPLSEEFVEKVAVVSLNSALRLLHENRIVHCDVKPENILVSDDEQSLVLADYGICSVMGSDGYVLKEIQGTLAYAPRVEQHFSEVKMDEAYDYGAMGLVLIALLCGKGLFDGMNNEEIFQAWVRGVEIPSKITGRFKMLIQGLLQEPEERIGQKEVTQWCEGDIVLGKYKKQTEKPEHIEPMVIAIVNGKAIVVSEVREFAVEVLKNWEAAKARIFDNPNVRTILKRFLDQFGEEYFDKISKYLDYPDKNKTLFCVAYTLFPRKEIYYNGYYLGSLETLFDIQKEQEYNNVLVKFINSDVLEFFMQVNEYGEDLQRAVKELIQVSGNDGDFLFYLLQYSFAREKVLAIENTMLRDMNDLGKLLLEVGTARVMSGENRIRLYAWLYSLGYGEEVRMMRKRDESEQ